MEKKSIVLGKVCLTPQGTYNPQTVYEQLDIIDWKGSSWLVLQEFSGIEPVAGNGYVMLLASKGEQGNPFRYEDFTAEQLAALKGSPGSGLTLSGYFATLEELIDTITHPQPGEAYAVGTEEPFTVYICDGLTGDWIDNGPVVGITGPAGKSAYECYLDGGGTLTEEEFNEAIAQFATQDDLSSLKIGAGNLLRNSGFEDGLNYWRINVPNTEPNEIIQEPDSPSGYALRFSTDGAKTHGVYQQPIVKDKDASYTFSLFIKSSVEGKKAAFVVGGEAEYFFLTTDYQKVTFTIHGNYKRDSVAIVGVIDDIEADIYFYAPMLVKGEGIISDWIPSYIDFAQRHTALTNNTHLIPDTDGQYDIGTLNQRFRNIHTSGTIYTGGKTAQADEQPGCMLGGGVIGLFADRSYIDFHYGNSTKDFTSRIIECEEGQLGLHGKLQIGSLSAGTNTNNSSLYVNGTSYFGGDTQISGNIYTHGKTEANDGKSGLMFGYGYLELVRDMPYIDFHYGNSTKDFTSRIIECEEGQLGIHGKLQIGSSSAGTNINNSSLYVAGTSQLNGNVTINGNLTVTGSVNSAAAPGRMVLSSTHNIGDIYLDLMDSGKDKTAVPAGRFMELYEAVDCECRLSLPGSTLVLYPTMFYKNTEGDKKEIRISTTAGQEYADFLFEYTDGASEAEVTLDISDTSSPHSVHLEVSYLLAKGEEKDSDNND